MKLNSDTSKLEAPVTVAPKQLHSTVRWIKGPVSSPPKKRTLKAMNAWFAANEDALLQAAQANCLQMTGKPSL